MVQGPGIPTQNYFCVFMCAKRPGEIHPNGNSNDHWEGPGTGGWGGKERWSGETPNYNCCVNMSIFYKLAVRCFQLEMTESSLGWILWELLQAPM